jgi:hypothetical protein
MEGDAWRQAIEAVVYELARHNGESLMDRGVALARRVEELSRSWGLAGAFEIFKAERGYRGEESGEELFSRVEALASAGASRTLMAA